MMMKALTERLFRNLSRHEIEREVDEELRFPRLVDAGKPATRHFLEERGGRRDAWEMSNRLEVVCRISKQESSSYDCRQVFANHDSAA